MGVDIYLCQRSVASDGAAKTAVLETGDPVFCGACGYEVATDLQGVPLCAHGMAYVRTASEFFSQSTLPEFGDPVICIPCGGSVATDVAGNRLCEH